MKRTSIIQCNTINLERGNFAFKRKRLGAEVGSKGLGTSWFELPPGKKAFPFHFHLANEEAIYVLEGEGSLRSGADEEVPLRPGDYISFPPGPPGHQVINRGAVPLRYLALSTMIEPEVAVYPDSKKVGFIARGQGLSSVYKEESAADYYDGEE